MTIAFRNAEAEDRPFIVSTWSTSFKGSHFAGLIHCDDWADVMHKQIVRLLDAPASRAVIGYDAASPTFFYGFIAGDTSDAANPVVYYVFVKKPYRKEGYARALFGALGVDPAHRFTYVCRTGFVQQLGRKIPFADWNPLVVRFPEGHPIRRHPL
jgi:GNAT superfamily N-acetyltransferase